MLFFESEDSEFFKLFVNRKKQIENHSLILDMLHE